MFKECSLCRHSWQKREHFLTDPDIEIVGYQVCFDGAKDGLFLFNHLCETTLALKVQEFEDLHTGPKYEAVLTGTEECPGLCLHVDQLDACDARCEFASVRDIIQTIRKWPKG
ncbi:MAG: hypothetical protein R3297_05700 [Desulfobulbales bacterium]|nr:hypothetical protein [Desulfobulbales bacterium]